MRLIMNKLLLIGLLGFVLGACSTATDTGKDAEHTTKDPLGETVEATEKTEATSIVADEMTTTFYPEVTKLRELTEEDLEWYDIIITRLNAINDHSGDRDTVYEIAEEYGEDPEELWDNWLEIVDAKWYGDTGAYAILSADYHKLTDEIIDKNIVGEELEYISGEFILDEEELTTSQSYKTLVDGETYEINYKLDHRDDFKIAEIIEFSINGKKIEL